MKQQIVSISIHYTNLLTGISIYNIMIASVLTVPLVNILSVQQTNLIYGITVISMLTCATMTLALVFGTKVNVITHFSLSK